MDVGDFSAPVFADLDGDRDFDAVIGEEDGILNYFENAGTTLAPEFTEQIGSLNPFDGLNRGGPSVPALADLDGDGDLDALVGGGSGRLRVYWNLGDKFAVIDPERSGVQPFDGLFVGGSSTPTFADLDDDGDEDALIGAGNGTLKYRENIGSALSPVFVERIAAANPFGTVDIGQSSSPAFADLDTDGDQDVIVGEADGLLNYLKNTGSALTPIIELQTGLDNPFSDVDVGMGSSPAFADLDGDQDLDAVIGSTGSALQYFENTGSLLVPAFTERTTSLSPFLGVNMGGSGRVSFADWDGDDDIDALIGSAEGTLRYFMNSGTQLNALFLEQLNSANPFHDVDLGSRSAPTFTDLDGDGDMDTIVGAADGTVSYYETRYECDAIPSAACRNAVVELDVSGNAEINASAIDAGSMDDGVTSLVLDRSAFTCADLGDNTVTLTVTDSLGNTDTCMATVTVQDSSGPKILLIGDANVAVACGDTYTDAGATAVDACEGLVSFSVVGDTVDTETPGVYQITYDATDGINTATRVTRTVTVLDNCPPDGEGVADGAADGEGSADGEGVTEGTPEGEGGADARYNDLLQSFALAESSGNKTLTLAEIQSVLPGFTEQDLDAADESGDGELSVGELLQRVGGGILSSADTNGDSAVQLTELLRLLQLFNAGQYACAENAGATEDGFSLTAPPSEPACVLHSVDQNGDKTISLSELLRGIQLYNLGGYTWCPGGTEDGFCG